MLDSIAEKLKDDWKLFLKTLINEALSEEIPTEGESGKKTIIKYFESKLWFVKWDDLESTLSKMEKRDIIEQIKKGFLYTKGTTILTLKSNFFSNLFFFTFFKNRKLNVINAFHYKF